MKLFFLNIGYALAFFTVVACWQPAGVWMSSSGDGELYVSNCGRSGTDTDN